MPNSVRKIALFGGTGFIGQHLATALRKAGHCVSIFTRQPKEKVRWRTLLSVEIVTVDPKNYTQLREKLAGYDTIINLIGIIIEERNDTFKQIHNDIMTNLVRCANELNIHRFVHISALGADANRAPSQYLRSKGEAEQYLCTYFYNKTGMTIFRPSIIFGMGDHFVSHFARLLPKMLFRFLPILPLPGARTRFAPVYIEDLVQMMVHSLDDPKDFGQTIDVCGPQTLSLAELMLQIGQARDIKPIILALPDWLARLQCFILEHLPGSLITIDQYNSMSIDSVSAHARRGRIYLASILPRIIQDIENKDPYAPLRRAARRL